MSSSRCPFPFLLPHKLRMWFPEPCHLFRLRIQEGTHAAGMEPRELSGLGVQLLISAALRIYMACQVTSRRGLPGRAGLKCCFLLEVHDFSYQRTRLKFSHRTVDEGASDRSHPLLHCSEWGTIPEPSRVSLSSRVSAGCCHTLMHFHWRLGWHSPLCTSLGCLNHFFL